MTPKEKEFVTIAELVKRVAHKIRLCIGCCWNNNLNSMDNKNYNLDD